MLGRLDEVDASLSNSQAKLAELEARARALAESSGAPEPEALDPSLEALREEVRIQRRKAAEAAASVEARVAAICSSIGRWAGTELPTAAELAAVDADTERARQATADATQAARAARRASEALQRERAATSTAGSGEDPVEAWLGTARELAVGLERQADSLRIVQQEVDRLGEIDRTADEVARRIDESLTASAGNAPSERTAEDLAEVRTLVESVGRRAIEGSESSQQRTADLDETAGRSDRLIELLEELAANRPPTTRPEADTGSSTTLADAAEGSALDASASLDRLERCRIDLEAARDRTRASESETANASGSDPASGGAPESTDDDWTRGSLKDDDWVQGTRAERDDPCRGPRPEYAAGLARVESAAASRDLEALTAALADLPVGCPGDAETLARLRDAAVSVARAEADANEARMRRDLGRSRARRRARADAWASAAAVLAEATRTLSRGADTPRAPSSGANAGSEGSGGTGCRVVASDPEGPRAFNFDYQYWIEETSLGATSAFKVQRMLYDDSAPPSGSGRTFHGPYDSRDAADSALDRMCPPSRRSNG